MSNLFSGVRGQERAVKILSSQLTSGDLSHAYLFLGKEGSGKEFLARVFSRYVLCDSGKEDNCSNCKSFESGTHPDFLVVDGGDKSIKIDAIRSAAERLNLSPNLSSRKVLLLSGADNMTIEASNALLKTLEEPSANSCIIMTAVTTRSLPETIVSRSQAIKFKRLGDDDIKSILRGEFGENNLDLAVSLSDGSVARAMRMMADSTDLEANKSLQNDAKKLHGSESIVEKFKIIEKYEKDKKIKELFDAYSTQLFNNIAHEAKDGKSSKRDIDRGKEVLNIYGNLNYNVSLRISLENIIVKEQANA